MKFSEITVAGDFSSSYQGCFGGFPVVFGGVLRCFKVFQGVLRCFGAENMMMWSLLAAFRGSKLGKMGGKSRSTVIFRPRTKAVLGVSQWCLGVFEGVLRCSKVF